MRYAEFLVEYNRNITVKNTSPKIINALAADKSVDLSNSLLRLRELIKHSVETDTPIRPEKIPEIMEAIIAEIEGVDPSPDKKFVPWLARVYSKGGVKFEDLNRAGMLTLYYMAKQKNKLLPHHKDINSFKTYREFEDTMVDNYDPEDLENEDENQEKPQARKVFENAEVLIIVPENETAACKYGRNTRWCTAAVSSYNYFEQYNRQGKLYILIPKNPEHDGEKYQLHFETGSFMDEDDYSVPLLDLLDRRFGKEVLEFFKNEREEIKNTILFMEDEKLQPVIELIKQKAEEYFWDKTSEWEWQDEGYYDYLRDKGYVDEEGSIDWDIVPEKDYYWEYNDDMRYLHRDLMAAIDLSGLRDFISENIEDYDFSNLTMKNLAEFIGDMLDKNIREISRRDDSRVIQEIGEKLQKLYVLPDGENGWKLK